MFFRMKYLVIITALFVTNIYFLAAQNINEHNAEEPVIFVEDSVINFGKVSHGAKLTKEISVVNKGERVLKIANVRGSCGLMVVSYPRQEIAPGESAIINIKYDTSRIGKFERILTIHSNSSHNTIRLRITGEIIP